MSLNLTRRRFLAASAASLTLLSLPAFAAGDDALAFAQSLYKLDGLWSDIAKDRAKYLGPELIAAMTANDKFGDDPDYALDYDPLVQAQDWDELKDLKFTMEQSSADKATIRVDFTNMEDPTTVRLNLVHTPQGWRLADVHDSEGYSLTQEYTELNSGAGGEGSDDTDQDQEDDSGGGNDNGSGDNSGSGAQ
jgi:hypothetical protein